jgi:methionine-S-sulfoxide reductase
MKRFLTAFMPAVPIAALAGVCVLRNHMATGGPQAEPVPTQTAVFAGGCFWGLQAAFDKVPGVVRTRVGYTGGTSADPTYSLVAAGKTGHAEAVEVVFDPHRVSYAQLVEYFFNHHRFLRDEPGADYRTRPYRSEIFVKGPGQREVAERVRREVVARNHTDLPMGTLVEESATFWEGEAWNQKYLAGCPK